MSIINQSKESESEEVSRRLAELAQLEMYLAEREAFLEKTKSELEEFEKNYYKHILDRFVKLDRIKAEILIEQKNKNLNLITVNPICDESFQDILEQEEYLVENEIEGGINKIELTLHSKKTKQIYRKLAKLIHPDLALNEEERKYRENIMVRANQAYANNDENKLFSILDIVEKQIQPMFIESTYNSEQLSCVICKISQVKLEISDIEEQIEELQKSEVYQLKLEIERSSSKKENLFTNMIAQLDQEIELLNKELENLKKN